MPAKIASLRQSWNKCLAWPGKLDGLRHHDLVLGCNNGLILSGARVYYAMAKDGLFFRKVGELHPKYRTPVVSLMVQMVWTCILCVSGSYGQLLDYIVFAVLVFYILTIVALFVLRVKRPNAERPYRAIGYPVLPAIYIVMAYLSMLCCCATSRSLPGLD